jgi:long-chain acyl-CoA synthetase
VVALVQPVAADRAGPDLTADILRHCAAHLAGFKHPKIIEYRVTLPRTPTGKLSRTRVREEYLSRQ